jgi:hypothetical protein
MGLTGVFFGSVFHHAIDFELLELGGKSLGQSDDFIDNALSSRAGPV